MLIWDLLASAANFLKKMSSGTRSRCSLSVLYRVGLSRCVILPTPTLGTEVWKSNSLPPRASIMRKAACRAGPIALSGCTAQQKWCATRKACMVILPTSRGRLLATLAHCTVRLHSTAAACAVATPWHCYRWCAKPASTGQEQKGYATRELFGDLAHPLVLFVTLYLNRFQRKPAISDQH